MIERYINNTPKEMRSGDVLIKQVSVSAIEKAQRYETRLVIQSSNGQIREVTPSEMKRLVSKSKK